MNPYGTLRPLAHLDVAAIAEWTPTRITLTLTATSAILAGVVAFVARLVAVTS